MHTFVEAQRDLRGLTSAVERTLLAWLAARMPAWLRPDHLTALGLAAMAAAGAAYALARRDSGWLHVVNVGLALNWFGDSLDGTLARHRHKLRPRYGFYVDHIVDAFGALFLLVGLGVSGYMSPAVAAGLLVVYYLLSIGIYLATYTLGTFRIAYGGFGGTELRLLLVAGNLTALYVPAFELWGTRVRLFDVGGVMAIAGLALVVVTSTVRNTRELYRLERL